MKTITKKKMSTQMIRAWNWSGTMTYEKTQDGFNKDTDELLNKICVTFHDELKVLADKYGTITVLLKTVED